MPHSEQLRRAMDVKSGHAALFCPPHPQQATLSH